MAIGGLISNRNLGFFIGSGNERGILYQRLGGLNGAEVPNRVVMHLCCQRSNALSPSHQQRQFLSLQAATLQHALGGHRGRSFGCFLLPGIKESRNSKINRSRASYKSEEESDGVVDSLPSADGSAEAILVQGNLQNAASPWWQQFPRRWVIVLLCFASFLLCNMDRVNMSIAILPMSQEYNWNSATVGLIQSSFFWGYLLTQILGGIWADKFGGKVVLGFGVVWWSIATVMTPIAAKLGLPFLLVVRAFMGIGEGVAMPAMNNMLSKWIPVSERSRSLALVYSGMYLGSVTGLGFSPMLIHKFGWPSVFYSFGSLGSIWFLLWLKYAYSSPKDDPGLSDEEKKVILGGSKPREPVTVIPWKLILSKPPVLKFNLTESGLLCVLPWFTMAVFANVGDHAINWFSGSCILPVSTEPCQNSSNGGSLHGMQSGLHTCRHKFILLRIQGSDAFSQSGLYSNHQDIGPRYAGVLLGLSNTAGVLAGVFGTAATGYILQRGSWDDVFKVAVGLYLIGTLVWNLFATGEKVLD
ncbi:hypothetical protein Bca4012_019308 [Brassica carinata]